MRYTLVMTRVKIEYMLFAAMLLVAGAAYGRGPVVAAVGSGPWANPDLYVGEWYEIARFDHPFQEGTVGSRVYGHEIEMYTIEQGEKRDKRQ